jgi:hypothetical protein
LRRGQTWSYDLLVGLSIFAFTLSLISAIELSVFNSTRTHTIEQVADSAWDLSGTMLSPGNPRDWQELLDPEDPSTWDPLLVAGMGESFSSRRISVDKARALMAMDAADYEALKAKARSPYNFFVEVTESYNCSSLEVQASDINCTAKGISPGMQEWNSLEHFATVDGANFSFGLNYARENASVGTASVSNSVAEYNGSIVRVRVVVWTNRTS